jgi:hypothetical protein
MLMGARCGPRGDICVLRIDLDTCMRYVGRSVELSGGWKHSDDARLSAFAGLDKHRETSWSFHPL